MGINIISALKPKRCLAANQSGVLSINDIRRAENTFGTESIKLDGCDDIFTRSIWIANDDYRWLLLVVDIVEENHKFYVDGKLVD